MDLVLVDLTRMGELERSKLVAETKQTKKFSLRKSLQSLATMAVLEEHQYFLNLPSNPFSRLPGKIIHFILDMIAKSRRTSDHRLPLYRETAFVCLLLNEFVTEFDFDQFRANLTYNEKVLWKCLKANCPKISKVCRNETLPNRRLPLDIWLTEAELIEQTSYLRTNKNLESVPRIKDIIQWKNLKFFSFRGIVCNDANLKVIQKHLPLLEGLKMTFKCDIDNPLSMESVQHLSNMQNLKFFSIHFEYPGFQHEEIIAHMAGRIPNLQVLDIIGHNIFWGGFFSVFAKKYPKKKLTLHDISWQSEFHTDWHKLKISINTLRLDGSKFDGSSFLRVSKLPSPNNLFMCKMLDSEFYEIIENIGSSVQHLHIGPQPVDLQMPRVVSACPKLESLALNDLAYYADHFQVDLGPHTFQDLKRFKSFKSGSTMMKMFLLGSEYVGERVEVDTDGARGLMEVLSENPGRLSKVEEIKMNLEIMNRDLGLCLKSLTSLIVGCPALTLVEVQFNKEAGDATMVQLILDHFDWFTDFVHKVGVRFVCDNLEFKAPAL